MLKNHISKSLRISSGLFLLSILLFNLLGCTTVNEKQEIRDRIAQEVSQELNTKIDVWYPKVIDYEYGGYISSFSHDWELTGSQEKMIVTQARHLWTLSKIIHLYPDIQEYQDYAEHGFEFLKDHMWDEDYGGFFQLVTQQGDPIPNAQGGENYQKTLYGNAFAIYGLAAYYGATENQRSLELAIQTFNWLESHSHDKEYGGYFQPLDRDGTPRRSGYPKDYNSGIHILEALTELYMVWPDDLVRERLTEMFHVVRDTMVTDVGYLKLYFAEDWTHLSYQDSTETEIRANIGRDHVTPGHDIETSYLLLEAAHALGMADDPRTHEIAKLLTDHTLNTGWDSEAGGLYDTAYYFPGDDEITILRDTKNWWAQAEALNTLLIMANLYTDDPQNYFDKFVQQWEYINENLIDHEHGGWYNSGLDKQPDSITSRKSQIWKGNYHTIRALIGVLEGLEKE